jgi:hypothetical protein
MHIVSVKVVELCYYQDMSGFEGVDHLPIISMNHHPADSWFLEYDITTCQNPQ